MIYMNLFYVVYAIEDEHIITGIYADNYNHLHRILKKENKNIQILESHILDSLSDEEQILIDLYHENP